MGRRAQFSSAQHAARLYKKGRSGVFLPFQLRCSRDRGIVGIVKGGYPDETACDRKHRHYDAGSKSEAPRWFTVDVKLVRKFERVITLDELRRHAGKALKDFVLLRRGSRLSVMPVAQKEWDFVLTLE